MTPWWVTLVVAGLGLIGTVAAGLGGVIITQRASDLRERAARDAQQQQEHEKWLREDRMHLQERRDRTEEQRVAAYVALLKGLTRLQLVYFTPDAEWDTESDYHMHFLDAVAAVELYGRQDIAKQASTLPNLVHMLPAMSSDVRDRVGHSALQVGDNLRSWIRDDLGIEGVDGSARGEPEQAS